MPSGLPTKAEREGKDLNAALARASSCAYMWQVWRFIEREIR